MQYLYRHFDEAGTLLYVGISLNALARLAQHRSVSPWFVKIANMTIERFETRREVEEAERKAIRDEKPLHNVAGKPREPMLREDASRLELTARIVSFDALYTEKEAFTVLKMTRGSLRSKVANGDISAIIRTDSKGIDRTFFTGWALVDFLEREQAQSKRKPAELAVAA